MPNGEEADQPGMRTRRTAARTWTKRSPSPAAYPYFIQKLGYAVWTVAEGPQSTFEDVQVAVPAYETKLDSSFFQVRLDRATELQRAYLRAMAQLGPDPQKAADVAEVMGRTR